MERRIILLKSTYEKLAMEYSDNNGHKIIYSFFIYINVMGLKEELLLDKSHQLDEGEPFPPP